MKTALYDKHVALGGKMVEFSGWEMPIYYKGIIHEHHAVRQHVGIFDVSHMGRVLVEGKDAERFLDYVSTNKIIGKDNLTATYTVLGDATGGSVDDVIIYKQAPERFFVVVNAGNRGKDLEHLKKEGLHFDVSITDRYRDEGILAIQGPDACSLMSKLFPGAAQLKKMRFAPEVYKGTPLILARTGYTGSDGFEVYAPIDAIVALWDDLLEEGASYGIEPIGLGARDTLRLEAGYALYGHELSDVIAPVESVSSWTVKWDHRNFLGKPVLHALANSPTKRSQYGIILLDKGIAREGYEVVKEGVVIGKVTSGTLSPTLNQAIAIVLVQGALQEGDLVDVVIRGNLVKAKVVRLPFWQL